MPELNQDQAPQEQSEQETGHAPGQAPEGQPEEGPQIGPIPYDQLPEELRPAYRSMQADYTRKTQSLAKVRQWESVVERLEELGATPAQIAAYLEHAQEQPAASGTTSLTGDPELDADPELQELASVASQAVTDFEQRLLRTAIRTRVDLLRDQKQRSQQQQDMTLDQLKRSAEYGDLLKDPARVRELQQFQRREGLRSLESAAKLFFHDELIARAKAVGRSSQDRARAASLPSGTLGGRTTPAGIPPEVAAGDLSDMVAWVQTHAPNLLEP